MRVLIEPSKTSTFIVWLYSLHLNDFGSRKNIGKLNGRSLLLLILDDFSNRFFHGVTLSNGLVVIVTLVCVLITFDDSFVGSWMINIVIPGRNRVLEVLSNGDHFALRLIDEMLLSILHHGRCRLSVTLAHLHGLFLEVIHCSNGLLTLSLEHRLQGLLLGDWIQRNVGID